MRHFKLSTIAVLVAACTLLVLPAIAAAAQQQPTAFQSHLGALLSFAGAFATSAALAGVKNLDTRTTNSKAFRKLQPVLTVVGALAAPLLGQKLGVQLEPGALAAAPWGSIAAITAAELLAISRRSLHIPEQPAAFR
jgi:hypothetical protein